MSLYRTLQFHVRIGDNNNSLTCLKPQSQLEGLVVDYTTDNGIVWKPLRVLDPFSLSDRPHVISITLPEAAKTNSTAFRWWQPNIGPGQRRLSLFFTNIA